MNPNAQSPDLRPIVTNAIHAARETNLALDAPDTPNYPEIRLDNVRKELKTNERAPKTAEQLAIEYALTGDVDLVGDCLSIATETEKNGTPPISPTKVFGILSVAYGARASLQRQTVEMLRNGRPGSFADLKIIQELEKMAALFRLLSQDEANKIIEASQKKDTRSSSVA